MEQEDQETVLMMMMMMNPYFSLGGHMIRSHNNHLIANPPESGETTQSRVLRENPNKSFKVAAGESSNAKEQNEEDALLHEKKLCKECGKIFESWKALFGHMKCHSQKTVKGFAGFPNRKKRSRRRAAAISMMRYEVDNNSSTLTSANSTDDYDQEEVAMSLIMLSNNYDNNNNNNPDEVPGSQVFKKQKSCGGGGSEIPTNETKFQCSTCSKTFHSYQALGGHRASHKKNCNNDSFAPPSQALAEKVESSERMKADGDDRHECPICFKIFRSGQALGGHKRSHFKPGAAKMDMQQQPETMQKPETRDFLDLNFPAPVEEEEEDRERQQIIGFQAWLMMGRNYNHEQIVGPTSF